MESRDDFLKLHWRPFPEAPAGTLDVSEYQRRQPEQAWVGGRICSKSPLVFESHGTTLSLAEDEVVSLDQFENSSTAEFPGGTSIPETHLRPGDWCFFLRAHGARGGRPIRSEIFLAAPAGPPLETREFGLEESRRWMEFLASVRTVFASEDFVELATPYLVDSPGTEVYLNAFSTRLRFGRRDSEVFLPTSPELHLKKALARGWARVFEIKTCFRNDEEGPHHQPEFHMLEWYRSFAQLEDLIGDLRQLFLQFEKQGWLPEVPAFEVAAVAEMFQRYAGLKLTPQTSREELFRWCNHLDVHATADDSWDDLFYRIFLERIENRWDTERLLILVDYPATQSALARIGANGWSDRFEVYWRGMELANAFSELNDPAENRRRYERDRAERESLARPVLPPDLDFFRHVDSGLPPAAGIALGLDRLYMAVFQKTDIAQTRLFPHGAE